MQVSIEATRHMGPMVHLISNAPSSLAFPLQVMEVIRGGSDISALARAPRPLRFPWVAVFGGCRSVQIRSYER